MVIKIYDHEYEVKYCLRSMFIMEEITGKPFKVETLLDSYIFCYSCIMAGNTGASLEFDAFIDYCEDHPEVLAEFSEFMVHEVNKREMMPGKKKVKESL